MQVVGGRPWICVREPKLDVCGRLRAVAWNVKVLQQVLGATTAAHPKKRFWGGVWGGSLFFRRFFSANEFAINAYQLSANAWWRRNCIFQWVLIYTVLL